MKYLPAHGIAVSARLNTTKKAQFLAAYVNKTHILTCFLQHVNSKKVLHVKIIVPNVSNVKLSRGATNRGEGLRACFRKFSGFVFPLKFLLIVQTQNRNFNM